MIKKRSSSRELSSNGRACAIFIGRRRLSLEEITIEIIFNNNNIIDDDIINIRFTLKT